MITRHYRVTGRVQGVGFRYFTQSTARRLGLSGWVRNCYDGSVELEAQGTERDLQRLEERLRMGPSFGRVENLEIDQLEGAEPMRGFTIRF